jgi:hypothetical protein
MIRITIEGTHSKHRMAFDVLLRAPRDEGRGSFEVTTRSGDGIVSFATPATWAVAIASCALRALEETGDFRVPDVVTLPGDEPVDPAPTPEELREIVRRADNYGYGRGGCSNAGQAARDRSELVELLRRSGVLARKVGR